MARKKSYNSTTARSAPKKSKMPPWKIWAGALAALILIMVILELTNTTHLFHKQKIPAIIPSAQNAAQSSVKPNDSATNSSASTTTTAPDNSKTPSSTGGSTDTSQPLVAPYGTFISNHYPGVNGSPTTENSVCSTTAGASCYISFTNTSSNVTTRLGTQVTDSSGSTTWTSWDVDKDAHLTSGNWQVTAVATLGSQTKSTPDPTPLVIK